LNRNPKIDSPKRLRFAFPNGASRKQCGAFEKRNAIRNALRVLLSGLLFALRAQNREKTVKAQGRRNRKKHKARLPALLQSKIARVSVGNTNKKPALSDANCFG